MRYDIYWPKLFSGRFIRRYQRFKVDILLDNGDFITAHCPNSGSLKGCLAEGNKVYVSVQNKPSRKFQYTWEMVDLTSSLVLINTFLTNSIVKYAILRHKIKELADYNEIKTEFIYKKGSRIDFLLKNNEESCLLEVKSCTLLEEGIAFFPDAPTERGKKHLRILSDASKSGVRSIMLYLVHRMDAFGFRPACHVDFIYCEELKRSIESGVEILVYDILIDLIGISINEKIDFLGIY